MVYIKENSTSQYKYILLDYIYIYINRIIKKACKLTHFPFPYTDELLTNACIKKLKTILEDNSHPLHTNLKFSSRSGRLIYLKTNRERYKNSFMPLSVKLLTQQNK